MASGCFPVTEPARSKESAPIPQSGRASQEETSHGPQALGTFQIDNGFHL